MSIRIEDMVEKSMPVTSNIKVNTREGYFASEATIKPNEVKISGAESAVSRVSKLVVSGTKEDVYESILESYDIKAIDESGKEVTDISTSDKVANVEIKVSKGKAVKVNIATSGQLPNQFKMKS
ncbi:hypothetical protein GNF77_16855, partial [Clostridium perfringens]|nr:hypothetical protein [Clostridium perfringens]